MPYSISYGRKHTQVKPIGKWNILPFLFLLLCGLLRLYMPQLDEITRQYLFSAEAVDAFSSFLELDASIIDVFSVF